MSSHFAADAPDPKVQDFAKRYEKEFGKPPGAMAALGYDVLFVLADAVTRCSNPKDPDALAKAIRETKGVAGCDTSCSNGPRWTTCPSCISATQSPKWAASPTS